MGVLAQVNRSRQIRKSVDEVRVVRCGRASGPEVFGMVSHTVQRVS